MDKKKQWHWVSDLVIFSWLPYFLGPRRCDCWLHNADADIHANMLFFLLTLWSNGRVFCQGTLVMTCVSCADGGRGHGKNVSRSMMYGKGEGTKKKKDRGEERDIWKRMVEKSKHINVSAVFFICFVLCSSSPCLSFDLMYCTFSFSSLMWRRRHVQYMKAWPKMGLGSHPSHPRCML